MIVDTLRKFAWATALCFAYLAACFVFPGWLFWTCVGIGLLVVFYEIIFRAAPIGWEDEAGYHEWCELDDDFMEDRRVGR